MNSKIPAGEKLTVGLDRGDRRHTACVLDASGEILAVETIVNPRECLAAFSARFPTATIVMETGTHCSTHRPPGGHAVRLTLHCAPGHADGVTIFALARFVPVGEAAAAVDTRRSPSAPLRKPRAASAFPAEFAQAFFQGVRVAADRPVEPDFAVAAPVVNCHHRRILVDIQAHVLFNVSGACLRFRLFWLLFALHPLPGGSALLRENRAQRTSTLYFPAARSRSYNVWAKVPLTVFHCQLGSPP
jgi:hypothetical protein